MARVARMPLTDEALAVLASGLRDPNVVLHYQAKIVTVPGSECLWWSGAISGRGHGRKRAELASRAHLARRPAMGLALMPLTEIPQCCSSKFPTLWLGEVSSLLRREGVDEVG